MSVIECNQLYAQTENNVKLFIHPVVYNAHSVWANACPPGRIRRLPVTGIQVSPDCLTGKMLQEGAAKDGITRQTHNQWERVMTKTVRVENADSGTEFKVIVQVWEKGYPEGSPDTLVAEHRLAHPTAMTPDSLYITDSRYLVVKEAKS